MRAMTTDAKTRGRTRAYTLSRKLGHPRIRHQGRPVRPRDAASLILVRDNSGETEVLMGKRHRTARFVPDAFVFPGGKVDAADRLAQPATQLDAPITKMAVRGNAAVAQALAMTAIRETWEETGLLAATTGDIGQVGGEADFNETWADMKARGQAPDLKALTYLGRAITSPYSPIRFHARFFVARAENFEGEIGGSGELLDLHWTPIGRALAELPIVDVTEFMLAEVQRVLADPDKAADRPLFAYRLDAPFVRYD